MKSTNEVTIETLYDIFVENTCDKKTGEVDNNYFPLWIEENNYREQLEEIAIETLIGSMEYNEIPYEEFKENASKLTIEELLNNLEY